MRADFLPDKMPSPFGGPSERCQTISVSRIVDMYRKKCGVDVSTAFRNIEVVCLYRCMRTGYRFWRPAEVAGDETFYQSLSAAWANYYRTERWEYPRARKYLNEEATALEIGCGRGHYLRSIESRVQHALGVEFNAEAIETKVTKFPMVRSSVELLASQRPGEFQIVHAFQVLEHVPDPCSFIESALTCLADGGFLVLSTPNHEHEAFKYQEDAFDLPPHHIGHFDALTYKSIADLLGIEVIEVAIEEREPVVGGILGALISAFRPKRAGPGPNIMVVYRK